MSAAPSPSPWPIKAYVGSDSARPYGPDFFDRSDKSTDNVFYKPPRLVTHIDDNAISVLKEYYASVLPPSGKVLDICSSWISHLPTDLETRAKQTTSSLNNATTSQSSNNNQNANPNQPSKPSTTPSEQLEIFGLGMNPEELSSNPCLAHWIVHDLNHDPRIPVPALTLQNRDDPSMAAESLPLEEDSLDAATCVVSIDYLVRPVEMLSSVHSLLKPEGRVHLVVSNRCFPTKAIRGWLEASEDERLQICGRYLGEAGFKGIEIVTLCDGKTTGAASGGRGGSGGLQGLMGLLREGTDPLWVVRGERRV